MTEGAREEEYREALLEAFRANGGQLHRDEGIEVLRREFDLSEERAEEVLERHADFDEAGVSYLEDEYRNGERVATPTDPDAADPIPEAADPDGTDSNPGRTDGEAADTAPGTGATAPGAETRDRAAHRQAILDAFESNNGRLHRDEAIDRLRQRFGVDKDRALEILREHVRFNDQGWTFSTKHTTFDGDVGSLNQHPGEITGKKWNGLEVLQDIGHPLVPDQGTYLDRTIEGTSEKDATVLAHAMSDPDFSPLLVGDAGTGKDTLVRYVCAKTNRPCVRVNFGEDVRYADLVGMRVPSDGEEDSEDDGGGVKVVWEDGMLTRAVKYGYVFIADEINAAPPEATMPLHQITEEGSDAELVIREESKVVTPHPQFRFVATMNPPRGGYGGVEPLNDAFKSRFYTIEVDYLDSDQEAELLRSRFEGEDLDVGDDEIEQLTDLAAGLREQYQRGDIVTPVTTRELIKIGKMSDLMSVKEAARMVLGGHAKENDEQLVISRINSELDA